MKDKLFLLKPNFMDNGQGPFYCPDSLPVEGLLSFYPNLRDLIEVTYVDYPRPRQILIQELGESNQGLPVLILNETNIPAVNHLNVMGYEGKYFLSDERQIREYLSIIYGVGHSHAMKNNIISGIEKCE